MPAKKKPQKKQVPLSERLLLSPAEIGALIGCSRSKVFELISSGALPPSHKLGGSRVIKRSDIERWIELNMPKLDDFLKLTGGRR